MSECTYRVCYGGIILAKGMSLGNAMLFVEAMFQKFYNEPGLTYTIMRESEESEV